MGVIVGRDVEDIAGRGLWDHQRMAGGTRHDVEERQHVLVLIDLVAGKLAAQDFCKDIVGVIGGHGGGSSNHVVISRWDQKRQASSPLLRNGPASESSRPTSAT